MSPYVLAAFLISLGLGTTITFASSHWLFAWMGLEINTLAIIPIMAQHRHPRSIEATTKYFLTQATAAALLLFAALTNAWTTGQWSIDQMMHPLSITLLTVALMLKLGLAPFHMWLPDVLQGVDLTTGLILSTWQKIAPFIILLQINFQNPATLIIIGLTSILVGGWGGFNQTQLRKILAYSSIAHLGWMIIALQFSPSITLLTLLTYFLMTSAAFLTLKLNNTTSINRLTTAWTYAPAITALVPLIMLSLGGLPPLTGFLPKWLIIQELTKQALPLTATLAALSALFSLYFYLRLTYNSALVISPNNLPPTAMWRLSPAKGTLLLATLASAALMLLPLSPLATTLTDL
uniref:NADH-ubiquinone oxidoreductase chain 2 n=1 Tax=Limnichthys fasciatus TaxID=270600 RepID=A0A1V1FTH4_9TELE|nr:NADH dehydrogenase subunit 2 [Limnichthys fasciatus]BBU26061.1 NADH dehydrogenase subunit 2 [Limnichthys fasciatus]